MMNPAKQYLIIAPNWLGDLVMCQSLCALIKDREPDAQIHVMAAAHLAPVLDYFPQVSSVINHPFKGGDLQLGARYRFAKSLRGRFDHAIVLPNSFKSALVPFWAKIPIRTGYVGEWRYGLLNDIRVLDKAAIPKMVGRYMALGVSKDSHVNLQGPRLSSDLRVSYASLGLQDKPTLVLCPGAAFGSAKQWPASHVAAVARHYIEQDWQVALLGAGNDKGIAQAICALVPEVTNLCGQTSLNQALAIIQGGQKVLSNDSGLMHVASAMDKPLLVVYGATSASHTPPMSHQAKTLSLSLSCQPCFKRECPLGHLNCMVQLRPNQVIEALEQLG